MTEADYRDLHYSFCFITEKRYRNYLELETAMNVLGGWCIHYSVEYAKFYAMCHAPNLQQPFEKIHNNNFKNIDKDNVKIIWQEHDLRLRVKTKQDLTLLKLLT